MGITIWRLLSVTGLGFSWQYPSHGRDIQPAAVGATLGAADPGTVGGQLGCCSNGNAFPDIGIAAGADFYVRNFKRYAKGLKPIG